MKGIENLKNTLPAIFARREVGRLTGGIIQPGTMANYDCIGDGISDRFLVGRKICYNRDSFITWLLSRVKDPKSK
jgi:hypothetical protein